MPFSAREVAPPAQSDWPAVSELKNRRKRLMKKERVGIVPRLVSHSGKLNGNLASRARRYARKRLCGSNLCGFFHTMMVFPSKNLSALCPGRNNL